MKKYSKPLFLLKNSQQLMRHYNLINTRNVSADNSRNGWKCVIGLEIHAQLMTKSKLFSSAPNEFALPVNSSVTLFDASIPGTLPVLNKGAVEMAVLSSLALGCKVNEISFFDRKHYFYPDMPAGYQITQQRVPLAVNGAVEFAVFQPGIISKPYYKVCKIKQIQLEQDSGKSMHDEGEKQSFIDLNRAGAALIEIVFEPNIEDEEEAVGLIKEVLQILKRAQTCSGKLEEGAFRIDVNVSVSLAGNDLGVRTEIKNIGSIHGVHKAIKNERERQLNIIKDGGVVKTETLMWDATSKKIIQMREKEGEKDYRFMPEPNLPPLRLLINEFSENLHKNVESKNEIFDLRYLKKEIPILPHQDRIFLMKQCGLSDIYAYNLVNHEKLLSYFKEIMAENSLRNPKTTYLLLFHQFLNGLEVHNLELENCHVPAWHLGQIVDLLQKRRISKMTGEFLVKELLKDSNSLSPLELVEKNGLEIISNPRELRKFCLRVIDKEIGLVASYRKRKKSIFNELVKKVIEETKYRADTQVLPQVMAEVLGEKTEKDV